MKSRHVHQRLLHRLHVRIAAEARRIADVGGVAVADRRDVEDHRHALLEPAVGRQEVGIGAEAAERGAVAEPGEWLVEELRHASCAKVILHQGAGVTLGHARIELRLDGANAVVGEPLRGAEGLQLFQVEASEFHGDSGGWVDRMS